MRGTFRENKAVFKQLNVINDVTINGALTVGGMPFVTGMINNVYYVDQTTGSDNNSGTKSDEPFATIQVAITASNATIDWSTTPDQYNIIYVAPGVYAENLTPPYYCHVVGTGIRGTDTMAEIHPTTGSCVTGTLLGTHFQNLRFEVNEAVPCLDIGICNNSIIEFCTFTNGAAVAATAIDTENCTHLTVRYCNVESGQLTGMAYGLYHRGGADKFAHNCRIHDNNIHCTTAGIWIENTCTASQYTAWNNFIARPTKGIDDNNGGSFLYNNYVPVASIAPVALLIT